MSHECGTSLPEISDILRRRSQLPPFSGHSLKSKMATRSGISGKKVPYDILHNLSSADILYDNKKMKNRRKILGVFEAERLIAQRRDKEVIA